MISPNIAILWLKPADSMESIVRMESIFLMLFFYDGMVLVSHAHLSSTISPFPIYYDQAALPHQLPTDVYFSDIFYFYLSLVNKVLDF